jgi:hypothetical protein
MRLFFRARQCARIINRDAVALYFAQIGSRSRTRRIRRWSAGMSCLLSVPAGAGGARRRSLPRVMLPVTV